MPKIKTAKETFVSNNNNSNEKFEIKNKKSSTSKLEQDKDFTSTSEKLLDETVVRKTNCDHQDESNIHKGTNVNETDNLLRKKKKRKASKKTISGSGNWALLCSEMKTDPFARKTQPVRKAKEEDDAIQEPVQKLLKPDIWFDGVDEMLLDDSNEEKRDVSGSSKSLVKEHSFTGQTNCLGIDCEMVGVGSSGEDSILARVSLVNLYGNCLYDQFVLPREKVTDYRTAVSGVTKELIEKKGQPFLQVQKEVSDMIQGKILVGHALHHDLKVLFLSHPHKHIRDTSLYKPFQDLFNGKRPSLKKLTAKLLGVEVQEGEHSSVEDAQAAMRLYTMHRKKWEKELKNVYRMKKKKAKKKKKQNGSL